MHCKRDDVFIIEYHILTKADKWNIETLLVRPKLRSNRLYAKKIEKDWIPDTKTPDYWYTLIFILKIFKK